MKKYHLLLIGLSLIGASFSNSIIAANESASSKTLSTSRYTLSYDQIKMAAESGDADAQYALGYMFYYGKGGAPKDTNLAKLWISKAAASHQPQAVKALALMKGRQPSSAQQETTVAAQETNLSRKPDTLASSVAVEKESTEKQPMTEESVSAKTNETLTLVKATPKKTTQEIAKTQLSSSKEELYTLQLLGGFDQHPIQKLQKNSPLDKAKIYKTTFHNKDWYVLIYGKYDSRSEAKMAAKELEEKFALQPWVRPYASLKAMSLSE